MNLCQPSTDANIVIGFTYGHPGVKIVGFLDEYSNCLEQLTKKEPFTKILDDFNDNLRDNIKNPQVINYLNLIESNRAFHLITKRTRLTDTSATVIAHKITYFAPYILSNNQTDHDPVLRIIVRNLKNKEFNKDSPMYSDRKTIRILSSKFHKL